MKNTKNAKNTPAAKAPVTPNTPDNVTPNTPAANAAPAPVKVDAPYKAGAKMLRTEIFLTDVTDAATGENVLDVLNSQNAGADFVGMTYAARCFRSVSAWLLYGERCKALSDAVGDILSADAGFLKNANAQKDAENAARALLEIVSVDVDNVGTPKAKLPDAAAFVNAVKAYLKARDVKSNARTARGVTGVVSPTTGRAAIERALVTFMRGNLILNRADYNTRATLNKAATGANAAAIAFVESIKAEQFAAAIWAGIDANDAARAGERLSAERAWKAAQKVAERAGRVYVSRGETLDAAVKAARVACDVHILEYAPRADVPAHVFIFVGADGKLYTRRPTIDALKDAGKAAYTAERERAKAAAEKAAADAAAAEKAAA